MLSRRFARVCAQAAGAILFVLLTAASVSAQYGRPMMSDPRPGEDYHVEAALGWWPTSLDATVRSDSLDIIGDPIDVKDDLGYEDQTLTEFRVVLRPARKHKFRIARMVVDFEGEAILEREIVFNGVTYPVGVPIQTEFEWTTWRFGYEYDFVYRRWGYIGVLFEARQTEAEVALRTPVRDEFTRIRGPIPSISGVARLYPTNRLGITVEFGGLKFPEVDEYEGTLFDFDLSGTYSFNRHLGVQFGYRSLNLDYEADEDEGDLQVKGLYFLGVARF